MRRERPCIRGCARPGRGRWHSAAEMRSAGVFPPGGPQEGIQVSGAQQCSADDASADRAPPEDVVDREAVVAVLNDEVPPAAHSRHPGERVGGAEIARVVRSGRWRWGDAVANRSVQRVEVPRLLDDPVRIIDSEERAGPSDVAQGMLVVRRQAESFGIDVVGFAELAEKGHMRGVPEEPVLPLCVSPGQDAIQGDVSCLQATEQSLSYRTEQGQIRPRPGSPFVTVAASGQRPARWGRRPPCERGVRPGDRRPLT